jgi:hypothetical protein
METLKQSGAITNEKLDFAMRISTFVCDGNTSCKELLQPLVDKGIIAEPGKTNTNGQIKVPIQSKIGSRDAWKALLVLRIRNVVTLAVSADACLV